MEVSLRQTPLDLQTDVIRSVPDTVIPNLPNAAALLPPMPSSITQSLPRLIHREAIALVAETSGKRKPTKRKLHKVVKAYKFG